MSSLQRWDPFRGLVWAQRDLDHLFDSFFGRPLLRWEQEEGVRVPVVDLSETERKEETYHRQERVWGRFERTIPLPAEVVTDQVKAVFKDGVLEVRLPKTEQAKAATPKRIEIE